MAKYRQVHCDFWQDAFVLDLTPEEKYFYLYLMTNSKTKQCGVYELPKRIIETETGYNRETVEKLLQRFVDYGKIQYNDTTKEIMLINWIKYNRIQSPKVIACIAKELNEVKHKPFVSTFLEVCKEYGYRIDTVSKDYGEEEEKEEKKNKKKDNAYSNEFEQFWSFYPRKVDKKKAYKAFNTAIKKHSLETIVEGTKKYAKSVKGKEAQYIKHAATFLNNESFIDGYEEVQEVKHVPNNREFAEEDFLF